MKIELIKKLKERKIYCFLTKIHRVFAVYSVRKNFLITFFSSRCNEIEQNFILRWIQFEIIWSYLYN